MAAPPTPDLSTLTSSTQIFTARAYTLPQIRAIHKALHAQIDDKAARLRTQVGGSYRELLGTADIIVHMRSDMDTAQAILGRMGGRCGRTVVNAKVAGLGRFVGEREDVHLDSGKSLGTEARRRMVQGVMLALASVLRRRHGKKDDGGDGLVLAAKLWVLGRLLVKSFGGGDKEDDGSPLVAASAKKNLEQLHTRLLAGIDAILRSGSDRTARQGGVLKALTAYSLAKSCGARDVLRHFLHVRSQAIALVFVAADVSGEERPSAAAAAGAPKDVLKCLALYTRTLQDVQSLVPQKLMDALASLKKHALLDDESLQAIEGLRLDVYKRWCGDEIHFFTPFIRHDDLDGRQAKEMLSKWAQDGSDVLLKGLEKTLGGMTEFKAIVDLRTSVLRLWIAKGGKARGFDPSIILDRIRDSINGHLLMVLDTKVVKLRLVGSEVSAALEAWREGTTDRYQGLWNDDSFETDLSRGAAQFTQDVVARLYGRNDAVSKALNCYRSWFHVIDDVGQVVGQLRRHRWDNDVDEIEDEETIEHRQKLLAKDDPQKLSDHLDVSLAKALQSLDEHLKRLWNAHREGPNKGAIAMYFLRLIRDIRARLPELDSTKQAFGLASVPSLQDALTSSVVVSPLDEFATVALARKTVVCRALWEGDPPLPTSPSPGVFNFLRNLSVSMGDAGADLWSPATVAVLKRHVCGQLSEIWLDVVKSLSAKEMLREEVIQDEEATAEAGGEDPVREEVTDDAGAEEQKRPRGGKADVTPRQELFVQWFFDLCYLRFFLAASSVTGDLGEFKDLEKTIYQKTGLEGATARERMLKTSQEYWKRTSLLFGLLA
ncbi:hypothetical protein B0H63DRAFT_277308 [Podospora didyma]|uniref:Conserved oligomeric Golgi complex subunit 1 n=1 Tax=Podospora didyma TaxID=330526 RepID=A0AAE0KEQ3_9PEZI|nr:hypothetical protein B0H63DRAFT_277308 [Podospora didyma]